MTALRYVLLSLLLCLTATQAAAGKDSDDTPAMLTVSGRATLEVPADQVHMTLGVEAASADLDEAHAEATTKMDALVKAIEKLGLKSKSEFVIDRYTVDPQWTPRPRNPEPTWRPQIVGYKVSSSMRITTKKIKLAGKMIATGIDAGANDIGQLIFDLADPRTSRGEAIDAATRNALDDSRRLAAAAGVTLVKIQSLSLDGASATPVYPKAEYAMGTRMAAASPAPPIMSGDVTVQASVNLTWIIEGP